MWPGDVLPKADSFKAKAQSLGDMGRELQNAKSPAAIERVALRWPQIETTAKRTASRGRRKLVVGAVRVAMVQLLGSALEQVPVTAAVGKKLRDIYQTALRLNGFPPSEADCKRLQGLRAEAVVVRDSLKDLEVGEALERFLVALARGEAFLGLVDSEVLAWVKNHGIASQLRVAFG